jgi:hypothetical protein
MQVCSDSPTLCLTRNANSSIQTTRATSGIAQSDPIYPSLHPFWFEDLLGDMDLYVYSRKLRTGNLPAQPLGWIWCTSTPEEP